MENLRKGKMNWVRGSCIGRGCYGTVNMAFDKSDGRIFAVKSVDLRSCLAAQAEALETEIKFLRTISSPFVVRYISDDVTTENLTSFRNLHLEYMPCGTAAEVAKHPGYDEGILRSHVFCIASGLSHVHSMGIVHCDVKGRNVLLAPTPGAAKLGDFGSAAQFRSNCDAGAVPPRGSPLWMAPEVVRGEYQGPESDVWSLGCTMIEMVTGSPPWQDSGTDTLLKIGYSDELPEFPSQLSELGKDFLEKCLNRDRTKRWRCDQLLRHPFVASRAPLDHNSPRCVLDWVSSGFSDQEEEEEESDRRLSLDSELATRGRIGKLATNTGANWESHGWMEVRNVMRDEAAQVSVSCCCGDEEELEEGTRSVYSDSSRAEVEIGINFDLIETERVNLEFLEFCCLHGDDSKVFNYLTAGENVLFFLILLYVAAMICCSTWFIVIIVLQLLFKFYLRFQSSHVTILPKLLTLCAVFRFL